MMVTQFPKGTTARGLNKQTLQAREYPNKEEIEITFNVVPYARCS